MKFLYLHHYDAYRKYTNYFGEHQTFHRYLTDCFGKENSLFCAPK